MSGTPDLAEFRLRLTETIAWYHGLTIRANPRLDFRSAELTPPALSEIPSVAEVSVAVEVLATRRRELLVAQGRNFNDVVEDLAGGALVMFDPDGNLFDGAAEVASGGFFDGVNVAPWDLWVTYVQTKGPDSSDSWSMFDSYLLAWVPPDHLYLADEGIWVNPERCLAWANEHDDPFLSQLRLVGYL